MTQPNIPEFLEAAFADGFSYTDEPGNEYKFFRQEIGELTVNEGLIIACDPFLYNRDPPFSALFPVGKFPVELAIAQNDDDGRVAFSRIKFSGEIPVSWSMATCDGQEIARLKTDEIFGYGVDSGTGAFMDISGGEEFLEFMTEKENNFQILIDEMEKNYKHTWDWLMWSRNRVDVAMFKTGWGDGFYATYIGYDERGNICRLVTDFDLLF